MQTLQRATESGLSRFFDFLPQLLGALIIFIIGWILAAILKRIIHRALHAAKFDRVLLESSAGKFIERALHQPSMFVAKIVYWLVLLGFLSVALSSLNILALNAFMGTIYGYLPHVVAALAIFLIAGAISVTAVAFVGRVMGETALAKMISAVVPSIVMSVAVFMILSELMIAPAIVNITYTALVGSIALGMALAFGLGGREVAGRLLEQAYQSGRSKAASAGREVSQAADRTKREVREQARKAKR